MAPVGTIVLYVVNERDWKSRSRSLGLRDWFTTYGAPHVVEGTVTAQQATCTYTLPPGVIAYCTHVTYYDATGGLDAWYKLLAALHPIPDVEYEITGESYNTPTTGLPVALGKKVDLLLRIPGDKLRVQGTEQQE